MVGADPHDDAAGSGANRVGGDAGAPRGSAPPNAVPDDFTDFLRHHVGASAEASDKVANLRATQKHLSLEKKRVSMDIRNESKKRARRLANSAKLSTMDLVAVLGDRKLRADAKAAAKAKAKAGAS